MCDELGITEKEPDAKEMMKSLDFDELPHLHVSQSSRAVVGMVPPVSLRAKD